MSATLTWESKYSQVAYWRASLDKKPMGNLFFAYGLVSRKVKLQFLSEYPTWYHMTGLRTRNSQVEIKLLVKSTLRGIHTTFKLVYNIVRKLKKSLSGREAIR